MKLIAPCGMNCRLCRAYGRDKNGCSGCRGDDSLKPRYCVNCKITNCDEVIHRKFRYCFECGSYPCKRIKQMDKRYRVKYGMSVISNLDAIQQSGIRRFIRNQKETWICPECRNMLSVHKPRCLFCGYVWYDERGDDIQEG